MSMKMISEDNLYAGWDWNCAPPKHKEGVLTFQPTFIMCLVKYLLHLPEVEFLLSFQLSYPEIKCLVSSGKLFLVLTWTGAFLKSQKCIYNWIHTYWHLGLLVTAWQWVMCANKRALLRSDILIAMDRMKMVFWDVTIVVSSIWSLLSSSKR